MNFVQNSDPFSSLTVKELNRLVDAKCLELSDEEAVSIRHARSTALEKDGLVRICSRCINEDDIERLLLVDLNKSQESNILRAPVEVVETEESRRQKVSFTRRMSLAAFDDGQSLRGMLFKKGRGRTTFVRPWTERFVVLDYSLLTLRYWDISPTTARALNLDSTLPSESDLKGSIDIKGCTIEPLSAAESGKNHSFRILSNGEEVITLATPTAEETQEWINKLLSATEVRENAVLETRKKIATPAMYVHQSSGVSGRPSGRHRQSSVGRSSLGGDNEEVDTAVVDSVEALTVADQNV